MNRDLNPVSDLDNPGSGAGHHAGVTEVPFSSTNNGASRVGSYPDDDVLGVNDVGQPHLGADNRITHLGPVSTWASLEPRLMLRDQPSPIVRVQSRDLSHDQAATSHPMVTSYGGSGALTFQQHRSRHVMSRHWRTRYGQLGLRIW